MRTKFNSIDLFSGCGGLSEGMRQAGFETRVAVEIEPKAVLAFKMNHKTTFVFQKDIRKITAKEIKKHLNGEPLHLLAGCPTIEGIESEETTTDAVHKILYPKHTERVMQQIKMTPKNGGSRKDLPAEYILPCHKKENVGFNDIYGRLRWDDYATTITGGCLNPSKGRFLHPTKDWCITAREAALLQSFPKDYKFPANIPSTAIALLIGNALPPKFSYYQSLNIYKHIQEHIG